MAYFGHLNRALCFWTLFKVVVYIEVVRDNKSKRMRQQTIDTDFAIGHGNEKHDPLQSVNKEVARSGNKVK